MKKQYFRGSFADELWPAVSCGRRLVDAEVGRKWVRVREAVRWPTNRKRIRRDIWDALHAEPAAKPQHLDIKV
jgi:hypothetical protein